MLHAEVAIAEAITRARSIRVDKPENGWVAEGRAPMARARLKAVAWPFWASFPTLGGEFSKDGWPNSAAMWRGGLRDLEVLTKMHAKLQGVRRRAQPQPPLPCRHGCRMPHRCDDHHTEATCSRARHHRAGPTGILRSLQFGGLIREVTGRESFRAISLEGRRDLFGGMPRGHGDGKNPPNSEATITASVKPVGRLEARSWWQSRSAPHRGSRGQS